MKRPKILPFYMTYPLPMFYEEEDCIRKDLEYLQDMYPAEARKYQKKVSSVLDKFDYDGSIIYDEYPDRWAIYKMTGDIMAVLRREQGEEQILEEKWNWIQQMVQLLLCYEIYKRRHEKRGGYLRF